MKRYKPKMFIKDPDTEEISMFENYNLTHPYHIQLTMTKDLNGEWVKWEDVEKLLGKLGHEASTASLHYRLNELEEKVTALYKSIKPPNQIHSSEHYPCGCKLSDAWMIDGKMQCKCGLRR